MNERFPLGAPVNRPAQPDRTQIPGRPNWWLDRKGVEHYVEPAKPAPQKWWPT